MAAFLLCSAKALSDEIQKDQNVDQSAIMAAIFTTCVNGLQNEARSRGVSAELIDTLGQVKRIEHTIKLDRSQPEFVQTFADYFTKRVTDYRVTQGRELLKEHNELLKKLTKEYGVPSQYLVAFWGLEKFWYRA